MRLLRALVVGPDEVVRRQITNLLDDCGFESVEAADCITALQFASDDGIDLIVSDLSLSPAQSLQLLQIIQDGAFGRAPLPMIACADLAQAKALCGSRLLESERATLLTKPIELDAFVAALDEAFPAD